MAVTLHLPADAEITFRRIWGDTLDRRVLEALLMDGYRTGALSRYEVQRLLGHDSRWETEAWLGERGVDVSYSSDDLEDDRETLRRVLPRN